jgi:RNA polymerase sigma-70 factor, ECF subfamily
MNANFEASNNTEKQSLEEPLRGQESEHTNTTEVHLDDDHLISSGLGGNREAFNVLFARYRPLLYRLACRIVRKHEEAEDAVQNCSLLAYCKLESFKNEGAFRSWLARILVNEAIAILRKRKSQYRIASADAIGDEPKDIAERVPDPGPNPEILFAEKQQMKALEKKLAQLCTPQRSAFLLCGLWEYTAEEASAMLKVPAATIRSRLFRARKQLALLSA